MQFLKNIASAFLLGAFVVIMGGDLSLWWLAVSSVLLTLGVAIRTDSELDEVCHQCPPGPPGPVGPAGPPGPPFRDMPRKNYDD